MKKIFFLSLAFAMLWMESATAQQTGQILSPKTSAEGQSVKVTYGQPSKRGRVIFGGLVPYGKVWRAGANEATEITFDKDATVGGKPIKAGTYTFFAVPAESNWTIILNPELNQIGANNYDKIKDKDLLHIEVPVKKLDEPVEKLTYKFTDENNLIIEWDTTQVEIPISIS